MDALVRVGGRQGGEIETQGLGGGFKRAQGRGLTINLIKEGIGLGREMAIAFGDSVLSPRPFGVPELERSPALAMVFDLYAAFGGIELCEGFVGGLKLVERVADERISVATGQVDRVFNGDPGEHLMCAVTEHAVCGPEHAFDPIDRVGQGVLDGSTPSIAIPVIGLGVGCGVRRTTRREMLTTLQRDMFYRTQFAAAQKIPRFAQKRQHVLHVSDGDLLGGLGVKRE